MPDRSRTDYVRPDRQQSLWHTGAIAERERHAKDFIERAYQDAIYRSALPSLQGADCIECADNLYDAGFFDDGAKSLRDARAARMPDRWFMTPVHKIINRATSHSLSPSQRTAVLITTGGFAPIHYGHLEMMEIARRTLTEQGVLVLGGYLSPGHDDYVLPKCQGETLSAPYRLRLCQESVCESNWLMADGWEALGTERMVNFTDVILRLESYLKLHLPFSTEIKNNIEITYVFGGDNARFARAFVAGRSAVCVLRPGAEDAFEKYRDDPSVKTNERIVFADRASHKVSSRSIRVKEEATNHAVPPSYWQWTQALEKPDKSDERPKATYYIRDEGAWAAQHWSANSSDRAAYDRALADFRQALVQLFIESHDRAQPPDHCYDVAVQLLSLEEQIQAAARLARGHSVISLDPCISGDHNLKVSRCFPLSAPLSEADMIARPGADALSIQLDAIPHGHHILFDDDIFSGSTVQRVQELLPDQITIRAVCALTIRAKNKHNTLLDILDSRDFLAGAHEGGLVVELPRGEAGRAPYCLPYVSPAERASIPLGQEIDFSRRLWLINKCFFEALPDRIIVAQTNLAFARLIEAMGFDSTTAMSDVCQWHAEQLAKITQGALQHASA